jgi:hypothetical protein
MQRVSLSIIVLLGLSVSACAVAGDRAEMPSFQMLDVDGDQLITDDEFRAYRDQMQQGRGKGRGNPFEQADADGDGALSPAEFEALREMMRSRRGRPGA